MRCMVGEALPPTRVSGSIFLFSFADATLGLGDVHSITHSGNTTTAQPPTRCLQLMRVA